MNSSTTNSNINKESINLVEYSKIYFVHILFTIILVMILFKLYYSNPEGFNKYLGTSVFYTLLFAIFIFLIFRYYAVIKNFGERYPYIFAGQNFNVVSNAYILISIVLIGTIANAIFKNLGAYDPSNTNNIAVFINYAIILVVLLISIATFFGGGSSDIPGYENMSQDSLNALKSKNKYILLLALYVILVFGLYLFNPENIITKYGGSTILLIMFFGIVLLSMIVFYSYILNNPLSGKSANMVELIKNMLIIACSIGISGTFIYFILKNLGIFTQDHISNNTIGQYAFNLILLVVLLGIVWKLINSGNYLQNNPYFKLIINVLLYIPCLFVNIIDYILFETKQTKRTELVLLIIELVILFIYLVIYPRMRSSYYKQGGTQVVNNPISLEKENSVATYESLNNSMSYNYQYAMSFWFYINSTPPSYNSSFNKFTEILNYGNMPCIKYNAKSNTLLITIEVPKEKMVSIVDLTHKLEDSLEGDSPAIQSKIDNTINKLKDVTISNEYDKDNQRIIYKLDNVLLQKWNNIILNFNGGTLDIFYNGELVKSAIEAVSYINYDMLVVGTEGGISGDLCNLMYYNKPLDFYTIRKLYNIGKDKNPPCDTSNIDTIITPVF